MYFKFRCRLEITLVNCDRFGNHRPLCCINFGTISNGNKNISSISSRLWRDAIYNRNGAPILPQWLPLENIARSLPSTN